MCDKFFLEFILMYLANIDGVVAIYEVFRTLDISKGINKLITIKIICFSSFLTKIDALAFPLAKTNQMHFQAYVQIALS